MAYLEEEIGWAKSGLESGRDGGTWQTSVSAMKSSKREKMLDRGEKGHVVVEGKRDEMWLTLTLDPWGAGEGTGRALH